jgi:hypothetical protein
VEEVGEHGDWRRCGSRKYPMETDIQWKPGNSNMIHWISNMRMRSCSSLYQTFCQKTPAWVVVSRRKPPKLVYLHQSKPSQSRTRSPLLPY